MKTRKNLLTNIVYVLLCCFFMSGCSLFKTPSPTSRNPQKRTENQSKLRERALQEELQQCADEITSLITEYELFLGELDELENARSSVILAKELINYLKKETFGLASDQIRSQVVKGIDHYFTPSSVQLLSAHDLYGLLVDLGIRITALSVKLDELAELKKQGIILRQHHRILIREIFPDMAELQIMLIEHKKGTQEAGEAIRTIDGKMNYLSSKVEEWSVELKNIESEISP